MSTSFPAGRPGAAALVQQFSRRHPTLTGILGFCMFVALMIGFFQVKDAIHANTPEGRAEAAQRQAEAAREEQARADAFMIDLKQQFVATRLRDPASAEFVGARVVRKRGKEGVCGYVNARNGFGGMTGGQAFAVIGVEVLLSEESSQASRAIDSFCDT